MHDDADQNFKLSKADKEQAKSELRLDDKQLGSLLKKLKSIEGRDDKAFMDMLRTSSRNHYTLNQMVDRKARILLSANVLILSFVIGQAVIQTRIAGVDAPILILVGLVAMVSMLLSLLVVVPEKSQGRLDRQSFEKMEGNPLYFGNFIGMAEDEYSSLMMEMVSNRDFIYRAMIQDIFHIGKSLERKRRILRNSLFIFVAGLSVSFFIAVWVQSTTKVSANFPTIILQSQDSKHEISITTLGQKANSNFQTCAFDYSTRFNFPRLNQQSCSQQTGNRVAGEGRGTNVYSQPRNSNLILPPSFTAISG